MIKPFPRLPGLLKAAFKPRHGGSILSRLGGKERFHGKIGVREPLLRKEVEMKAEVFFKDCLDLDYPGLEEVKAAVWRSDYVAAKKEFGAYLRRTLDPECFFTIPYETPENVFKYPGESDAEACERIVRQNIFLSVGVPCDFGVGRPVDWLANPTVNQYKEWTWQFSRHNEWKMLAHQYRLTGNDAYAQKVAELFRSWVAQAPCPESAPGYDTKCWRTIECGIRMGANWPYVLFAFFRTKHFTDELLFEWYASVWEHGNRLFHFCTKNNWLLMEMNGLAHIGILYRQLRQAKFWLQTALEKMLAETKRQFYPDGFHYELTTCYHEVAVNNYQRLFETAKAFACPLPPDLLTALRSACRLNVGLMMPDGKLPDINDGKKWNVAEILRPKQRMIPNDPLIDWAASHKTEGKAPAYTSLALPYAGFLAMRTGWDPNDTWALFDAGPFGKGHQHEDKLSLLIFTKGRLLLTEGGNYAYDDSPMRRYVLSSRAHNVIRVDGQGQNRRQSYVWQEDDIDRPAPDFLWHLHPDCDYASGVYREPFGDLPAGSIIHQRAIYFIKNGALAPFFLVVDRLTAETEHEYEWLWHIDDERLSVMPNGALAGDMAVLFSLPGLSLSILCGQTHPEWQGYIATSAEQGMYRPVNCLSAKTRGKDLRIVTAFLLAPEKAYGLTLRADADPASQEIDLANLDGQIWRFRESDLQLGRLPDNFMSQMSKV